MRDQLRETTLHDPNVKERVSDSLNAAVKLIKNNNDSAELKCDISAVL